MQSCHRPRRAWTKLSSNSSSLACAINKRARSFSVRPVALIGNPVLRVQCGATQPLPHERQDLIDTLTDFRRRNGFGRGIAAPQIGIPKRFIALQLEEDGTKTIPTRILQDPKITWKSDETMTLFDDCMSLPWILCKVQRHESISIKFENEQGQLEEWNKCPRALSELLQHEIDHLDGILITDIVQEGGIVAREEFESDTQRFQDEVDYVMIPVTKSMDKYR